MKYNMMSLNSDNNRHIAVCTTNATNPDDAVRATANFFNMVIGKPCDAVADDTGRIVYMRPRSRDPKRDFENWEDAQWG
jgi:hypothetical protein